MFINLLDPANQAFLKFFRVTNQLAFSPRHIGDPFGYGVHPNLLDVLWRRTPSLVPPDTSAWMVSGQPVLVQPHSGTILGVAVGSIGYALRLAQSPLDEARKTGVGHQFGVDEARWDFGKIGSDWIVGPFQCDETVPRWFRESWKAFGALGDETGIASLASWLDETIGSRNPSFIECVNDDVFDSYRLMVSGLESRGFAVSRVNNFIEIRQPGRGYCWEKQSSSEQPDIILVSGLGLNDLKPQLIAAAAESLESEGADFRCELIQTSSAVAVVFHDPVSPVDFFNLIFELRYASRGDEAVSIRAWFVSPGDQRKYFIKSGPKEVEDIKAVTVARDSFRVCFENAEILRDDVRIEYESEPKLESTKSVDLTLRLDANEFYGNLKFVEDYDPRY